MLPCARSSLSLALAGLLLPPVLTACSDSGSDGLGRDFSVEAALAALPDATDEEFLVVRTADLAEASDLAGTEPDDDDWVRSVSEGAVYVPFPYSFIQGADTGVEPQDADLFTSLQAGGDGVLEVFRLRDGDPPSDSDDAGGLVRVSEDDDTVVLASDDDWLERWRERDDTMADDDHFGGLAEALDDQGVYAAQLFSTATDRGPVRAYGVGQAVEGGEAVEYAVFALDDAEDAEERAEEIEDAWGATGAVENGELEVDDVDTDGQVVVVRLLAESAGATTQTLIQRLEFRFPE